MGTDVSDLENIARCLKLSSIKSNQFCIEGFKLNPEPFVFL